MTEKKHIGKIGRSELEDILVKNTGAKLEDVMVGPAYGEDSAAISVCGKTITISSDPIVFASRLAGNIASNDIAASGGTPRWLTNVVFTPDKQTLKKVASQVDEEAKRLGISVVGGHAEYTSDFDRPLIVMTCLGIAKKYIPTSGAEPGDKIVMTKDAGIEGASIIASDFKSELKDKISYDVIEKTESRLDDISVIEEGAILAEYANSMHDPTEGGVLNGLVEIAVSSGVSLSIDDIPVSEATEKVCSAVDVDPLKVFSSGVMLGTVPAKCAEKVVEKVREKGIRAKVIGSVLECKKSEDDEERAKDASKCGGKVLFSGSEYKRPVREDTYSLWN